jgi:hypothetical protein
VSEIKGIRFSVFRAVDNDLACQKYIEGHIHVLKVYGISQITSAKIDWILNPNVYVIIVESLETNEVLAGARLQVADGEHLLPIEDAVGHKDENVFSLVTGLRGEGTGELCGLWNSRKIAGYGIGSIFLGRTSVAVASQLNIKTLLALCAPTTKENCFKTGFTILERLGDKGEFFYPKEDLVATALIIPDIETLDWANPAERDKIKSLRKETTQSVVEQTRRGEVLVEYNLQIPHINSEESVEI